MESREVLELSDFDRRDCIERVEFTLEPLGFLPAEVGSDKSPCFQSVVLSGGFELIACLSGRLFLEQPIQRPRSTRGQ